MEGASVFIALMMFAFTAGSNVVNNSSSYVESSLLEHLLPKGELLIRPVQHQSQAVNVSISLAIVSIVDVDEVNQIFTSSMWIRFFWNNPFLKWDPKDYEGIDYINIDYTKIWSPDIFLVNSVHQTESSNLQIEMDTFIQLRYTGDIRWVSPFLFKTDCSIHIKHFPFDYQQCNLTFMSWTYDGNKLNLTVAQETMGADNTSFSENGEWILNGMEGYTEVLYERSSGLPYPYVAFQVDLERRTLYYLLNLIFPCLVITLLASLSFLLPPDGGERVGLVITVLLSLVVFLLMVAESVPTISLETPLISRFFVVLLVEIGISLVVTCLLIRLNQLHPNSAPPRWYKILIFKIISPLVFWRGCKSCTSSEESYTSTFPLRSNAEHIYENEAVGEDGDKDQKLKASKKSNQLSDELRILNEEIHYLVNLKREKQKEEEIQDEWKESILIIDRFLFILFILTSLLICLIIFLQAPFFSN